MKPPTLAEQINTPKPASPLLDKVKSFGLGAQELENLAIQRGCDYYRDGSKSFLVAISPWQLSNEELALAFLSPALPPNPRSIRIAAALLGAEAMDANQIAQLAAQEHCVGTVRYIAGCGHRFEPDNLFWTRLLEILPDEEVDPNPLPHPTRFVEMTGIDRGKVELRTRWIRPRRAIPA